MASTITLQNIVDYGRTQTRLIPIVGVGGLGQEPALSLCNDTLQEVLSSPYAWRFNRASIPPFTTVNYQQDYIVTGATAATPGAAGGIFPVKMSPLGASESGTTVTINTTYAHTIAVGNVVTITGMADPSYNGTFTCTTVPNSTSFTFTHTLSNLGPSGASGITNINWVERCVLEDFANTSNVKPRHNIEVVATLTIESIIQPPFKVSFETQQDDGSVTFRFWPVPSSQIWTAYLDYQVKPPIKTSLGNTWAPWPDELGYVLRQGFLSRALVFAEDPRAQQELQKFEMLLAKALGIKDQEMRSESFFPERPILFGG